MTFPLPSFIRFLLRAFSLLVLLSASLLTQGQTIRYVKPAATGTGNGSSWADASGNLQAMINVSVSDDQVWVAAGTFKPGGNANTNRTISFAMKGGVTIYGGFVGTEANVSQRPTINLTNPSSTTLSGDIGAVSDRTDNSFHVIKNPSGLTTTAVLDGFVITGGNATDSGNQQDIGGGMLNVGNRNFSNQPQGQASSPLIRNCLFQANSATSGGAMYNDADAGIGNSSPTLTNCVFQANTASSTGGAIYNNGYNDNGTSPTLTNCTFQANSASSNGGAIYNDGHDRANSSPAFTNCFFQDNRASSGGAIYNDGSLYGGNSSPTLTNCSFQTNRATSQGGAIYNYGKAGTSSPTLINCSFQTNSATSGGGMYNNASEGFSTGSGSGPSSSPKLINCWFQANTASSTGGAIYNLSTYEGTITVVLTNCTFQANSAPQGGAIYGYGYGNGYVATSTLTNCVLFGNGGANTFYNAYTTVSATYSLLDASVTGYSGNTGNITVTVSPFVSTTGPTLSGCGPAINAGLNSATGLAGITTDLAGNPRIVGGRVDMGAVEFQGPAAITAQPVAGSTVCAGGNVSVAVSVTGTVIAYQWYKNGSPVSGQTTATLLLPAATVTDAGTYSLAITGSCNSLTSSAFNLVVNPAQARLYVKAGASGANTGLSWADAFPDLQSALNYPCLGSASGTPTAEIWVAAGVYKPTSTINRSLSFAMRNGVTIYGGFVGNETALSQRVLSNPLSTILSGDIGTAGINADNSYHVFNNPTGLTNSAVLDGFLITGGNANGSTSPDDGGGGIINNGSGANNNCSPLIRNCLFQNNSAANGGGAIYNAGYTGGNSSPGLLNCAFQNNSAASRGGALYNDGSIGGISNPPLTNCSFQANSAGSGGAMYNLGYQGASRPNLTNCVVWGNGGASTFFNGPGAFITTSYSLFESSVTGYNAGSGNLTTTTSPFASATTTLLRCGSTAIDAGDPATTSATVGSIDLAGNNRFYANGHIDMGAYEAQGASNTITTPGVSTATLGVAFSQSFTASGGTSPYSYSLASGSLPTGLGLANTGVVSGTPTQLGSFTLTAMGRDAVGCSGVSAAYVLTVVNANPTLTGLVVSPGAVCVGRAATFTATVGNLTGSYSYTLTNGVSAPLTGSASSSPFSQSVTASGTGPQTFTLTVSANSRSASSVTTLVVNPSPVATLASSGTLSCANSSVTLTAGGGNSYTFASGSGVLGTPGAANTVVVTTAGTYSVMVASASGCVSTTSTVVTADQVVPSINISPSSATLSCASPTVSLTAVGSGLVRWSTGETTPVISVSAAGAYSVTLTGANSCTALATTTLQGDLAPPTDARLSSGTLTCSQTSLTLTASASGGVSYHFSGGTPVGMGQLVVTTAGLYSVTITGANGCSATASTSVQSSTATVTITNPTVSTATVGVSFSQSFTALGGTSPYSYTLANGSLPTGLNLATTGVLSGTPSQVGSFTITALAYDATGCSGVSTAYVLTVINATPTITGFSANPAALCVGSPVTFMATISNLMGSYSYTLTNGSSTQTGNSTSTTFNQSVTASGSGTQTFTLTASVNGQSASSVTTLTVNPLPMAGLTNNGPLSCAQTSVTLTADGGDTYQFAGPGIVSQIGNTAVVNTAGVYSVTVTSTASGCSSFTSITIDQDTNGLETSLEDSGPLTCAVTSVTLTANPEGQLYQFSQGASQIGSSNQATVSTPGLYSVTVISGNGCSSVSSVSVTQNNTAPVATITTNSSTTLTCTHTQVTLFASGGDRYEFAGPGIVSQEGSQALVNAAGVYSVTVTNNDTGCFSVTAITISQEAAPQATLTASPSATLSCAVRSVTLTAGGGNTGETLSYAFGGPGVVSQSGNRAVVNTAGVYSVTVTNTASGCSSTTTLTIDQNTSGPETSLAGSGPLTCAVSSVTLTASPAGQTYQFSAGTTQLGTSNQATVSSPGLYSVSVVSANGCSTTASVSVAQDNTQPVATLSANSSTTLTCSHTQVTLFAGGGDRYVFAGPGIVSQEGSQALVNTAGVYSVTVTNSSTGCFSVTSITIDQNNSVPQASLTSSGLITCATSSVTLTASPNGLSYAFAGPGVVSQNGNQAIVNASGTYSVTVSNGANGCSAVAQTTVTSDQSVPEVSLTNDGPLSCTMSTVTLMANPSELTYRFSAGATQVEGGNTATVNTAGTYSVTVTAGNGCSAVAQTTVTGDQSVPEVSLTNNGPLSCTMRTVTLTASPEGQSYRFSAGATQVGSGNTATLNTAGTYSVTVTSGNGCSAVAQTTVTGDQTAPSVSITANPSLTITQGQSATLTASGAVTYAWNNGANTPAIVVSTAGPYSVTGTSANGCTGTASVTLTVNPVVTAPFAITAVTTVDCTPVLPNRFSVSFTPRYSGLDGSPVSFSVTNELFPTTSPGPYTLQLYTDNPVITLEARQGGATTKYTYDWLAACNSATTPNTPPRVVMGIPGQTATVGQYFSYVIPDGTFTDTETPGSLRLSASGLPGGLSFSGATLSGTPSSTVGSPVSITITATDPGGLSASTPLVLSVQPAMGTPPPTVPFAITGVTTISCTPVADRININFTPRYAGLNGQPVAFEVVNETLPTTEPGPYSLTLYRDNPVLTLRATQTGSAGPVSYAYNWLSACQSVGQDNTPPRLNQPVASQTAVVGQAYSLNLTNTFIDQETPDQISLSAAGLPAGLSVNGKFISGTPSMSGVSSVTLTATDGGGLSTSTVFSFTVLSASTQPPTNPPTAPFSLTGVTTVSCEVISAGKRRVTFTPRYAGLDGSPVSFRVVNETLPTTNPGPYTLNLYTDNPVITLEATQSGVVSPFSYGWLAACNPGARVGAGPEVPLSVTVLGNPVLGESVEVEVRGAEGQALTLSVTDARGHQVSEQLVGRSGVVERQTLRLGQVPAGVLLLRVSTSTQSQTIKLLKAE